MPPVVVLVRHLPERSCVFVARQVDAVHLAVLRVDIHRGAEDEATKGKGPTDFETYLERLGLSISAGQMAVKCCSGD